MQFFNRVDIDTWAEIQERYSNYISPTLTGQQLLIFKEDQETTWLESKLLPVLGTDKKIKLAVLGALGPNNVLREHIDGHYPAPPNQTNWSLNIPILNCDKCEMLWYGGDYEVVVNNDDPATLDQTLMADNAQHLRANWLGEKQIKATTIINTPTAVRITVPHKVINHSNETRVMLAVRFSPDIF